MNNFINIGFKKLRFLLSITGLVSFSSLYSQGISSYNGTYKGKITFTNEWDQQDVKPESFEINEITVKIVANGTISIAYHMKIVDTEFEVGKKYYSEYIGTYEGGINKDLTYELPGKGQAKFYLDYFQTGNPQSREGTTKSIAFGKIVNDSLIGGFKNYDTDDPNRIITTGFLARILLAKSDEDCDINIIVPDEIKPGGDFYVQLEQKGCLSSYPVIWYNGSDKPIPKWDGKSVKVQVQAVCCNTRAFEKTFIVPEYGSGKQITVKNQNTGPLPVPPPKQLLVGPATSLLVLTLLQTLLGGGPKTVPPIPPKETPPRDPKPRTPKPIEPTPKEPQPKDPSPKEPLPKQEPPKDPLLKDPLPKDMPPKDRLPKDPLPKGPLPKEVLPKDVLPKDASPKGPSPEDKAEKLKILEGRLEDLKKLANQENISISSNFTLLKNLFQTIPASVIETKETLSSAVKTTYEAGKKAGDFVLELYDNPKERQRLNTNMADTINHLMYEACDFKNFIPNQIKQLKENISTNAKFNRDLMFHPVKTIKEYISDNFAIHNYENAMDPNRTLGCRLLNLGWAYGKTYSTISTGSSGSQIRMGLFHQKTIISQKLAPYFPGLLNDVKKKVIIEGVKVKANNYYYSNIDVKPENTTNLHNTNDILEEINKSFENKKSKDEEYSLWEKAMNHQTF